MSQKSRLDPAALLAELEALRHAVLVTQGALTQRWREHIQTREFAPSAANLAAYVGLRRHDLRDLQERLAGLGLSSLGRCEGHALASLDAVIHALRCMTGKRCDSGLVDDVARAMAQEESRLRRRTERLLGPAPSHRWTRFMVTLPSEAAADADFVRGLLERGMNCARINCAHDDPAAWESMVKNVRHASRETKLACKVLLDLAGPKLRTGPVAPGAPVLRLKPKRDAEGRTIQPAGVILDGSGAPGAPAGVNRLGQRTPARLSVDPRWLAQFNPGDTLAFRDLRGRRRKLVVEELLAGRQVLAACDDTAYIAPGIEFTHASRAGKKLSKGDRTLSGAFHPAPADIRVFEGDVLLLTRAERPGAPPRRNEAGRLLALPHISCEQPEIFDALEPGHAVWIDDGRIGAIVEGLDDTGAWLRITRARRKGERIAAEKGLNFPDTRIALPAITDKDLADLKFAVKHADLVGCSFVREASDIDRLTDALACFKSARLGIIAKIETREAVKNLPEIIVHGAGRHPFGVMIARGDLGVELGYERLAEIQEEILWIAEAAHVPVIWATQVLESLVKQDRPSRAEITDAAMAERAECVMLNKGPYLFDALKVLDSVVTRMQGHQQKKTARFRALHW